MNINKKNIVQAFALEKMEDEGVFPLMAVATGVASSSTEAQAVPPPPTGQHQPLILPSKRKGSDSDSDGEGDNIKDEEAGVEKGEEEGDVPVYKGRENARKVFANKYFYDDVELAPAVFKPKREEAITEEMTVRDVRLAYEGRNDGFTEFANKIGAHTYRVVAYFDRTSATVEQLLGDEVLPVALNAERELHEYVERGALALDTLNSTYQNRKPGAAGAARRMPLSVVTGSSGSGKTFFCFKYLTDFLKVEQKHSATLYLRPDPDITKVSFDLKRPIDEICKDLAAYIRTEIEKKFSKFGLKVKDKLNMHACVIFDEAGALDLCGRFEDKAFLKELCNHLGLHLAKSVAIVVSGTGITGTNLTSAGDAYFFRLKPWRPSDVRELFEQRKKDLVLKDGDTLETVVDAIFGHPKLRGLTSNARSAYFLRQAILSLCSSNVADSWPVQLDVWAPALVATVVHEYIAGNGIQGLEFDERRVVAASVFRALEDAALWKPDSEGLVLHPPSFDGLVSKSLAMARSLVTWNVELISTKPDGRQKVLELVKGERRVISVTPAIATVLFVMAGVQVSMIRGWRAEEEVAALYAARQVVLRCFDRFQADDEKLREELRKIRLHELRKQIQPFRKVAATQIDAGVRARKTKRSRVRVPIVSESSVLLNGDKASFADVIAPYMLLQAKHTSGKRVKVDMEHELGKCCLLKSCKDNNQVLRGLLSVWSGDAATTFQAAARISHQAGSAPAARVHVPHDLSNAYPENAVKYGESIDAVEYAFIERGASVIKAGDQKLKLPNLRGTEMCFVISTNAEVIDLVDIQLDGSPALKCDEPNDEADDGSSINSDDEEAETAGGGGGFAPSSRKRSLKVTPDMLEPDLQLKVESLGEFKEKWDELKKAVIPVVKIKFLFTAEARHLEQESSKDTADRPDGGGIDPVA
jgi:uncharacterized protein YukE